MPAADRHRDAWDALAARDPAWAVLGAARSDDVERIRQLGRDDLGHVLGRLDALGLPYGRDAALDVGCGIGRVTGALAERFARVVGVDVSQGMLAHAATTWGDPAPYELVLVDGRSLAPLADGTFDLVYSRLVLQHAPGARVALGLVEEIVRVLRPGGVAVFQLPSAMAAWARIQPRPRLYRALRRLGVRDAVLADRLGLHPIGMLAVPERRVRAALERAGGELVHVEDDVHEGPFRSRLYVARRP